MLCFWLGFEPAPRAQPYGPFIHPQSKKILELALREPSARHNYTALASILVLGTEGEALESRSSFAPHQA